MCELLSDLISLFYRVLTGKLKIFVAELQEWRSKKHAIPILLEENSLSDQTGNMPGIAGSSFHKTGKCWNREAAEFGGGSNEEGARDQAPDIAETDGWTVSQRLPKKVERLFALWT